MEGGHIEIEARELQIAGFCDDAPDGRRALQIGVLPVRVAAGVEESVVRDKRVAHGQLIPLKQIRYGGLWLLCGGVAEHPRAVRAELCFISIDGGFCFMVDRAQRVNVALTSKVWRFGNRHIILIAQFLYIHL